MTEGWREGGVVGRIIIHVASHFRARKTHTLAVARVLI